MYNIFEKAAERLAGWISPNTLIYIMLAAVCLVILFNILWIISARHKTRVRHHRIRRLIVLSAAWIITALSVLNLTGGFIGGDITAIGFLLPAMFILSVYFIESFIWAVFVCGRCHCARQTACVQTAVKAVIKEQPAVKETAVTQKAETAIQQKNETAQKITVTEQKPRVTETAVVSHVYTKNAPVKVKNKQVNKTKKTDKAKIRRMEERENKETEQIERENRRILELGNKIERQRQNDIQLTDEMVSTKDQAYAADTKAAIAEARDDEVRLAALQQKFAALKKTQHTERIINTTENRIAENKTISAVKEISSTQQVLSTESKTTVNKEVNVTAYRNESQVNSEVRQAAAVNASNTAVPVKGKYDENEVMRALLNLRGAMEKTAIKDNDDE